MEIKVAPDLQLVSPHNAWAGVQMFCTTRAGGVGSAPYDNFNLGLGAGDIPEIVQKNRQILRTILPADPVWLNGQSGLIEVTAGEGFIFTVILVLDSVLQPSFAVTVTE